MDGENMLNTGESFVQNKDTNHDLREDIPQITQCNEEKGSSLANYAKGLEELNESTHQ